MSEVQVDDNTQLITFTDPETNGSYTLLISKGDANRLENDHEFASSLYLYAKKQAMRKNPSQPVIQEEQDSQEHELGISGTDEVYSPLCDQEDSDSEDRDPEVRASTSEGDSRYTWQYKDTLLLISSVRDNFEELEKPNGSKHFWDIICNILVSNSYNVSKKVCQDKWSNLNRTYKNCKDKSGRASTRFMFLQEMDEILSQRPCMSKAGTLSSLKKNDMTSSGNSKENWSPNNSRKRGSALSKEQRAIAEAKLNLKKRRMDVEERKLEIEERKVKVIEEYLKLQRSM